jgi:hypothetical protein
MDSTRRTFQVETYNAEELERKIETVDWEGLAAWPWIAPLFAHDGCPVMVKVLFDTCSVEVTETTEPLPMPEPEPAGSDDDEVPF